MLSRVFLVILFAVFVVSTPVEKDDFEAIEDDVPEEDKQLEDGPLMEDYPEKDPDGDQNAPVGQEDNIVEEEEDGSVFTCVGKPGKQPDGSTIKYADPSSSHHWYECLQGVKKRYGCSPIHLVFNKLLQYCVETAPGPTSFCTGKPDGDYQNKLNCRTVIKCSNGITHVQKCPAGLYYNPPAKKCDWPGNLDLAKYPCAVASG